jgi:lipid-A-disaccharide synthase
MGQKHILIICGEASGDLHAAHLARAILKINPEIKISAVGAGLLREAGAQVFCDIKDLASIGLFDVLRKLPKFFALQKLILQKIKVDKPDALILVDFSGFNLRLAKAINPPTSSLGFARDDPERTKQVEGPLGIDDERSRTIKKSVPIIYYISPQVWASRPGRIKTIRKYIDKMIVLFKFEQDFFKRYGVDVDFTGHPLIDIVKPSMDEKEFLIQLGFSESKTTIALLPGSRRQEIENILPIMLEASILISKHMPNTQFVIAKSPQVDLNIYSSAAARFKINLRIIEGKTYDCLNIADFALVASGTATLEAAIIGKPFAVIYKMGLLNYLLYRPQVKTPYIGMVNIVAQRKIVPEFIQFQATPLKIAKETVRILNNPAEMKFIENNLRRVKGLLGEKDASLRASQIIIDFLNRDCPRQG